MKDNKDALLYLYSFNESDVFDFEHKKKNFFCIRNVNI